MPKRTERTILINELLILIDNNEFTAQDLLDKTNIRRLSHEARKYITSRSKSSYEQVIGAALRYMKYNYLINVSKYNFLSVTKIAKLRLQKHNIEHIIVLRPKIWDKKWRLVIFEIESQNTPQRNSFVSKLKQIGFKRLQDSVYIFPYRCEKQINQLIDYYQLKYQVFYLEANRVNNDLALKKLFPNLKNSKTKN